MYNTSTYQYPSRGQFRFGLFLQLRTIYKPTNEQQVRSKASTMSKSWPRIGNIDPFFVTTVPAGANESFSLNVYAIPVRDIENIRTKSKEKEMAKEKKERNKESFQVSRNGIVNFRKC